MGIHRKQLKRSHLCRPENDENPFPFLHLSSLSWLPSMWRRGRSQVKRVMGGEIAIMCWMNWIRRKKRDLGEKKNYKKRKLNNKDGKAKREKNRKGKLKEHNTKRKKKDRKTKSSKKRKGKNKTKYQKKKKKNGKNRGDKKERGMAGEREGETER